MTFHGTARRGEADLKLAEFATASGRGQLRSTSRTVKQLMEAALTLRGYRRVAECQIVPALGSRRVANATAEELDAFYRALAKPGLAASTIKQTHAVVRRASETSIRWRWISCNRLSAACSRDVWRPLWPRNVPSS